MSSNIPNPKLSLFPQGTTVDPEGQLTFQGHRAVELARQFSTPLYLFDVGTIRQQIETYRQSLVRYSGQSRLTYASKAVQCSALARLMTEEAVGLDVASAGEIYIAQQGGADPAEMHMHGNNKSYSDLAYALEMGVGRIVVDNRDELDRLVGLARERGQRAKIWLRLTPGVAVEVHRYMMTGAVDSKFGFPWAEAEAVASQLLIGPEAEWVQLTGLHIHLGSHFHDAEPVAEALDMLLESASSLHEKCGWEIQELCAGGGWGVRYHPEDPPMPVEPFVAGLAAAVEQSCRRRGLALPTFILEPGRSLVAQAGVALYTVGGRKIIPGVRTYVSIDGGLADNPRPALYQARYTALLANRAQEPEVETVAIAGPFCESGDVMIQAVTLPAARPGDVLAVPVAGAYHLAMGSNYNAALKPAVLFVDADEVRLIQRREQFEDLIRRDM
jgi:diaminopimelate decarboxylase